MQFTANKHSFELVKKNVPSFAQMPDSDKTLEMSRFIPENMIVQAFALARQFA